MKQMLALVGVVLFGFAAVAADVEPVYVVDIEADANLDEATVSVTQGGVTETMPFTELALTTGTFKKRGIGTLSGSVAMTNFTGTILIEEGAYVASLGGMLGPSNASAGDVVVSNGATVVFAYAKAKIAKVYNTFHIAGAGSERYPCAVQNACTASQQDSALYGDWYLEDDAVFGSGTSCSRMDYSGVTIYLQGHTLTYRKNHSNVPTFVYNNTTIEPAGGHIVIDGASFQPQSGGTWKTGDGTSTLTFRNNATYAYYGKGATAKGWTMIADGSMSVSPGGSATFNSGYGITNGAFWASDLYLKGGTVNIRNAAANRGYAVWGQVSGPGNLVMRDGWLHLCADDNTSTGSVAVWPVVQSTVPNGYDSGLALFKARSLNPESAGLALTNAPLRLMDDKIAYELPRTTVNVKADTNIVISGGTYGSAFADLQKTGAGTLELQAPASVTGTLELTEGTLVLRPTLRTYSGLSGLWKGVMLPVCTNSAGEVVELVKDAGGALVAPSGCTLVTTDVLTYMDQSATTLSNEVVTCMDWMRQPSYPPWTKWAAVSWGGYVWNRSATNETWRFAVAVCGFSRLWLDGTRIISTDDNGRVFFVDKVITPGPHMVLFKVCPRSYAGPGSIANPSMHTVNDVVVISKDDPKAYTWGPKMGFAINFDGLQSTNVVDFVFPENTAIGYDVGGGDGYRFTRDTRDVGDFTESELVTAARMGITYSNVVAKAGTTLDLGAGNAHSLPVRTFAGVTTVLNGGLLVTERLLMKTSDIENGGCLTVDGKLTFDAGARLVFDDEGSRKLKGRPAPFTVITAKDGIENLPEIDYDGDRWRFRLSDDGKSLVATYIPPGAVIIVK